MDDRGHGQGWMEAHTRAWTKVDGRPDDGRQSVDEERQGMDTRHKQGCKQGSRVDKDTDEEVSMKVFCCLSFNQDDDMA